MAKKIKTDIIPYYPPPRKLYWYLGSKRYWSLLPIPYAVKKINIKELRKVLLLDK